MPIYAGETVRIFSSALDWNDQVLTPPNGSASITIWDADGGEIVPSTVMVWMSNRNRWEFDWQTPEAGSYTIEVTSSMADQDVAKEVRHVTLSPTRPWNAPLGYFVRVED